MTATLNDLKKEARELYKRLERQALNTINKPDDIARYNHLIAKINGGDELEREESYDTKVDKVEQKTLTSKAEREIEEASKYRREEIKRIIALPSEVLYRVEKVEGGCWATGNPDMPEAQVNDKCPIRNACSGEENNSICQCNGGQACGKVKEFWRQKRIKIKIKQKIKKHTMENKMENTREMEGKKEQISAHRKWVEEYDSGIRADLSDADLRRADLAGADFSRASLPRANLTGADLTGANFFDADLSGADLTGANLSDADLTEADLTGANLASANLVGAVFYGAHLFRANLYGAHLSGADFSGADLREAKFPGAHLAGVNFSRANLADAVFYGADLTGADLSDADLPRINLYDADLRGANLARSDLSDADLSDADLSRADLSDADLFGADLSRADLSGANLSGTDLSKAVLFNLKIDDTAPSYILEAVNLYNKIKNILAKKMSEEIIKENESP